jgi:hypothetical protein
MMPTLKKGSNPTLSKKEKAMVYLLEKLGGEVAGRKKLVKLMFLIEHYDPVNHALVKKGLLDNTFIIYQYGVFSFEVMRDYTNLTRRNVLIERPTSQTQNRICINPAKRIPIVGLNEIIKSRVDRIAFDFGQCSPRDLEILTLEMLHIPIEDKAKYFGEEVGQQIDAMIANKPVSAVSA